MLHFKFPGTPQDSGISLQTVLELGPTTPLFGVCMGLQCIGEAFGGNFVFPSRKYYEIRILQRQSYFFHTSKFAWYGFFSFSRVNDNHIRGILILTK